MSALELSNIRKTYEESIAVDDVSLGIGSGEFLTLLGPSGCGKSTTLRIIAGLVRPDRGRISFDNADVTNVPTWQRNVGMMFQSLALFPHMTVAENVGFGLRMRKIAQAEAVGQVRAVLDTVQLAQYANRYPHQLSGGQQQRVALARALVVRPHVLLLDEPFGALDRKLREAMQVEVHALTRQLGITAVFVTHDQEEALVLSDFVAVMDKGRILQYGPPSEIYERPKNRFVADFMGNPNVLTGAVLETGGTHTMVKVDELVFTTGPLARVPNGSVEFAIRPEHIDLLTDVQTDVIGPGIVEASNYHGSVSSYRVKMVDSSVVLHVRRANGAVGHGYPVGTKVWVRCPAAAVQLLGD